MQLGLAQESIGEIHEWLQELTVLVSGSHSAGVGFAEEDGAGLLHRPISSAMR